mmetsp:Transcript_12489/g.38103  ORF Transcript_12489/g.38103 Transcript_12489/m.38103 type:complete len:564 (+) Transcript_12489:200-1891(+)
MTMEGVVGAAAFLPGYGLQVGTIDSRRSVCRRADVQRRAGFGGAQRGRAVIRAVVEPKKETDEEKKKTGGDEELPPEAKIKIPKRTTFAGLVYDRFLDTGSDVAQHLSRLVKKPKFDPKLKRPRMVILGSGWGAHSLAKVIDAIKYEVVVVSPRNYFLFTPMLPSTAVGTIEFRSIVEPIRKANEFIDYYEAVCTGVNWEEQVITCESIQKREDDDKPDLFNIPYDYLIVGVGATTNTFGIPGVRENCFFLKEIEHARSMRLGIIERFERANLPSVNEEEKRRLLHFVIVGGGPTGCEFAAELNDLVTQDMAKKYTKVLPFVKVSLLQRQASILTQFDEALQRRAMNSFKENNINIVTGANVVEIGKKEIKLQDGRNIPFGMAVWAAGNGPQPLIKELMQSIPAQQNARGRIIVDDWLRVKGAESIFALGDCAAMEAGALPATAQVAGQQGAYLGRLLNRDYCLSCEIPFASAKPNSNIETVGMSDLAKPFQFLSLGIMTYIGEEKSMIQFEAGEQKIKLSGALTYLLWQSVYATKQVSFRSRVLVLFDWLKTRVFGRDLSQF